MQAQVAVPELVEMDECKKQTQLLCERVYITSGMHVLIVQRTVTGKDDLSVEQERNAGQAPSLRMDDENEAIAPTHRDDGVSHDQERGGEGEDKNGQNREREEDAAETGNGIEGSSAQNREPTQRMRTRENYRALFDLIQEQTRTITALEDRVAALVSVLQSNGHTVPPNTAVDVYANLKSAREAAQGAVLLAAVGSGARESAEDVPDDEELFGEMMRILEGHGKE